MHLKNLKFNKLLIKAVYKPWFCQEGILMSKQKVAKLHFFNSNFQFPSTQAGTMVHVYGP